MSMNPMADRDSMLDITQMNIESTTYEHFQYFDPTFKEETAQKNFD